MVVGISASYVVAFLIRDFSKITLKLHYMLKIVTRYNYGRVTIFVMGSGNITVHFG